MMTFSFFHYLAPSDIQPGPVKLLLVLPEKTQGVRIISQHRMASIKQKIPWISCKQKRPPVSMWPSLRRLQNISNISIKNKPVFVWAVVNCKTPAPLVSSKFGAIQTATSGPPAPKNQATAIIHCLHRPTTI